MKTYAKYISKHLTKFLSFVILLIVFNALSFIFTFYGIISKDYGDTSPTQLLPNIAANCSINGISEEYASHLREHRIWAMFLDLSGNIQWAVDLPDSIPDSFSIQDVALFSKGYLYDYPVFVWNMDEGLLVLGYPKGSYMKLTTNYFSEKAVQIIPLYFLLLLAANSFLIFAAYFWSKKYIIKNTEPILSSIHSLANGQTCTVHINGELSEIADSLNHASFLLSRQNEARANWISGVSHDIRTPLSMIMGYADRIANTTDATTDIQEQAEIIRRQSIHIKELIADLNLVSKLEYDMQPLELKPIRLSTLLRSYIADLLNLGLNEKYTFQMEIAPSAEAIQIDGDIRLIKRAIDNLVQNSIKHNADGCEITIALNHINCDLQLTIKDNGIGISPKKRKELEKPHYMECLDERFDLRHGIGLLLVRRIMQAHKGTMEILDISDGYATILHFHIS